MLTVCEIEYINQYTLTNTNTHTHTHIYNIYIYIIYTYIYIYAYIYIYYIYVSVYRQCTFRKNTFSYNNRLNIPQLADY